MTTTPDRGLFVWHELNTSDTASADDFYSKLVGWKTTVWDQNPAYRIWTMGREAAAGLYSIHEERNAQPPPPHWLSYIATVDVDSTVRQAVELGGKVITPAYDVRRVGRMAVLQDPQGAMFAVSARLERAPYREAEVGEFSWHELLTTNPQTAWDFYSKLFGWAKAEAMDMGPGGMYQMFSADGHTLGGIFAPGGLSGGPRWLPYVLLRDAKRAAETAKELGATIANGPVEVPGGDLVFTGVDREGAMFAVHSRKRVAPVLTPNTKDTETTHGMKRTSKGNTKDTKENRKSTKKNTKDTKRNTKGANKNAKSRKKSAKGTKRNASSARSRTKPSR